ncbi:magnesium transporter [Paenibacillus larvae]|uniref:Magnesium transporter MgtE n=3 Tax=Paenibacillus larvae TaxID=1464 RepID=A0A2L1TNT6_9BACL|nr:magnesium transporter [Paenibacillus larvae]AQR76779.1 magnesium transporter [Paenibacillus larvae subsp. larvae]AQT83500.1 magnesium transporter [Paenibacillus larvae subsp. pulvifaciens]AQZ48605.1 magnesium transporter [Paenibacillus larvae subsp. pulvifaciens]ARF70629.1 magnesium transporter [Paenibacillus larvae subsp. pulvifaciens]AVF22338.1 magnesium transporter mgtE [Paenibacillus larvae subsp. larvae]
MKHILQQLLHSKDITLQKDLLYQNSFDIAKELKTCSHKDQVTLIELFPIENGAQIISHLTPEEQYRILTHLSDDKAKLLFDKQSIDDIVDVLLALHPNQAERLMDYLPKETQQNIKKLMEYSPETAGGHVTTDYIAAREHWSVKDTLSHIRKIGDRLESLSYIYVLDSLGHLNGVVSIRQLLLRKEDTVLSDIMNQSVISVNADSDQQEAAQKLTDYNFAALPVTTSDNRMIGIITFDDAIDVIQDEATKDIHQLGGSSPLNTPYFETSVWTVFRKRIGWLLLLFVAEAYTSTILSHYEDVLSQVVALAFFIPLLVGTGGNIGTQVTATLIRAISLGEVKIKHILRVMGKEALTGLLLGCALGIAMLIRSSIMGPSVGIEVAQVVSITVLCIIVWSSLVASVLPILLTKLKLDPAVVSGPFITTFVDGTGLIIYFTVATILLNL